MAPQLLESSAFSLPYFLQKTGKKVEAANAFLDAVQKYPRNTKVERTLRDAIGSTLYSGTSEIQRNIVAGWLGL